MKMNIYIDIIIVAVLAGGGGGGGTPLFEVSRYVRLQRVWFFNRFGHK